MSYRNTFLTDNRVVKGNKSLFQSDKKDEGINGSLGYKYSYEETIAALNGLQSNAALIAASKQDLNVAATNLKHVSESLKTLGIDEKQLRRLRAIHVAGTKGKGSTCALTECILRNSGLKTGFYSSPHLISVRERIRINGEPLAENLFVSYFWNTYKSLCDKRKDGWMPAYFNFLTILAFRVFLNENVDVAIIEVGIGGEYDSTNVIKSPTVVGITSIGIDHTSLLGDTLEKIAWQKAGILKKGVPAFTVPQNSGVLGVFLERSREKDCTIKLSPPFHSFRDECGNTLNLGMPGKIQEINASLALQLCRTWLSLVDPSQYPSLRKVDSHNEVSDSQASLISYAKTFPVIKPFVQALLKSKWAGRFQTIHRNSFVFFLDGAHTEDSISHCADWFVDVSHEEAKHVNGPVFKILIFNCTHGRKPELLLTPLLKGHFNLAIFSPNHVTKDIHSSADQTNFNVDPDIEYQQCLSNYKVWNYMQSSSSEVATRNIVGQTSLFQSDAARESLVFDCLTDAIDWITQGQETLDKTFLAETVVSSNLPPAKKELLEAKQVQVLITGSLHLVGGILKVLQTKYEELVL